MKRVAVTGGVASGKSTVSLFMKELGAYVLSADDIVHELLDPQSELGKKIVSLLGEEVIEKSGELSRAKIAALVFSSDEKLKQLEGLLHPQVQKTIETHYQATLTAARHSLFVVEIPLLFECGWQDHFDAVIVVTSDKKWRPLADTRERRLLPLSEKTKRADFVITNNGSLEELRKSTLNIYKQLTS